MPNATEQAQYESLDWTFGDHVDKPAVIDAGIYAGIIESVTLVMDSATKEPKVNENGKKSIDVAVRIDRDTVLKTRITISFGKNNQSQKWARMAQFVAAVTGIPCGNPDQAAIGPKDIVGNKCRIMVTVNENGYNNIDSFQPPAKPKPVAESAPTAFDPSEDSEIPF
jgi:hypothetical protein